MGDRDLYTSALEKGQVVETCEGGTGTLDKKKIAGNFFTI
jgi:hypothetical protein